MNALRPTAIMGAGMLALVLTAAGPDLADPAAAAPSTAGPTPHTIAHSTTTQPVKHTKHKRHHRKKHTSGSADRHASPDAPMPPGTGPGAGTPGTPPSGGGTGPGNPGAVDPPPLPKPGTPSAPHGAAVPRTGI